MFTDQEMSSLKFCAEDQTLEDHDREMINAVMHKIAMLHSAPKPQILVTIEGGSYQRATANMDIDLIIEDKDNLTKEMILYYPCLAGECQIDFDDALSKAKKRINKPVTEARIFIHDCEDDFPFNVQVNGEVIETHKTIEEAVEFLNEYLKARMT